MSEAHKRIVIAAGGTAGHVVPALAVAAALQAEGAEVSFIGGERAEAELVPAAGFVLHQLSVRGLSRSNPLAALRAIVLAGGAFFKARRLLGEIAPDALMGGGGYVAGPAGLAALTLRIPIVLTEADSHLGLTNRLLSRFARRVCLAFPIPGRSGSRYLVTGRPIPPLVSDREAARARFAIPPELRCLLVFGGSLGARSVTRLGRSFRRLPFRVLHVCGRRDYELIAERLPADRLDPQDGVQGRPGGYDLRPYLDLEDFAQALAAADLVVARAGGSVFELAAHGLPAVLVPYPHAAADHQSSNAAWMADAGAAVVMPDGELTGPRLGGEVANLLADPGRLESMSVAALELARPEAAADIAAEVLRGGCIVSAEKRPWAGRRIHVVGVGGAGMSAYARAARALGADVTGSDGSPGPYLDRLAEDAVLDAQIGHRAENVPAGEGVELVYSSAVGPENPERVAARERGIPELTRAELLGQLSALRRTIAVAGTHGKTTTASMIAHALLGAGMAPGWLIGAPIGGGLANAEWGQGEWLIIEADESDRSLLSLQVEIAVLTNVELDHHASFSSLGELRELFSAFLARAPQAVIWDRPELLELRSGPRVAYEPAQLELTSGGSRFQWQEREVRLAVPGAHNATDAAGALEASLLAGADPQAAITALGSFTGAGRRFQALGRSAAGALLYEDYAHHPTEVMATLRAARTLEHRRLVAVFQPHLFSRTALLAAEFGRALAEADVAVVLGVYPARERAEDFPGVSGLLLAETTADAAAGRPVYWLPTFADAERVLGTELAEGDVCVVMGAGDVEQLGHNLAAQGV